MCLRDAIHRHLQSVRALAKRKSLSDKLRKLIRKLLGRAATFKSTNYVNDAEKEFYW